MNSTTSINLSISETQKDLIADAASELGMNCEKFILTHCLQEARSILSSRTHFQLDSKEWEAMQKALDTPPSHAQLQNLIKLFATTPPWEK